MCGRFTLRTPTPVLMRAFQLSTGLDLQPRFNIAPTQDIPVIRQGPSGNRELSLLRWGLVPSWAKDLAIGSRMINARSETAAEKPSFRTAFRRRRCLVVADGYYEWKHEGKKKLPFWIRMTDERPFAMAGLWDRWCTADDQQPAIESCTILTTESNSLTSDLHDRMPVILEESDFGMWIDNEFYDTQWLETLMKPYASCAMKVDAANPVVNNARNEGPRCVEVQGELF